MLEISKQVLKKKFLIENIENKVSSSSAVIFYDFSLAKSDEIFSLKKQLKKLNCFWFVYKNTLFKKALESTLKEVSNDSKFALKGNNAFIFCENDQISPLKILNSFQFRNDYIKDRIQGGIYDNCFVEGIRLKELSNIPSKEFLLFGLCNLLMFELHRFIKFINEIEKQRFNDNMKTTATAIVDQEKVDLVLSIIENLNSVSLKTLNDKIKEKNGIDSSLDFSNSLPQQNDNQEKSETKSSYSLILKSVGSQRMQVYKALKEEEMIESGISIVEVKKRTDNIPYTISNEIDEEKANDWKNKLESFGATLEIKKN